MVITSCGIGIQFSNVTYGSILDSRMNDNIYFGILLNSSSNNIILTNNIETGSDIGFGLVSSNNNLLINNTADNNSMQGFCLGGFLNSNYWGSGGSNNNTLKSNEAINNYIYGFTLIDSSNNLIKNNIGNYNGFGDYFDFSNSPNNSLINNKFLVINNSFTNSLGIPLLSTTNIIIALVLITIYCLLGYMFYLNSQKRKMNNRYKKPDFKGSITNKEVIPFVLGILGSLIIIFWYSIFPYYVCPIYQLVLYYYCVSTFDF